VRIAIFSTYPPRACGIGTFSFDVRAALLEVGGIDDVSSVVVVDEPSSPQRPEILATVSQGVRRDYVRAARLLGRLDIDVVSFSSSTNTASSGVPTASTCSPSRGSWPSRSS